MNDAVVYRWPDGSTVICEVGPAVDSTLIQAVFLIEDPSIPMTEALFIDPHSKLVFSGDDRPFDEVFTRRVLGFLLDLGLDRKVSLSATSGPDLHIVSLITPGEYDDLAPYPLFVPDDRYESRYEDARRRVGRSPGRFLSWEQVEVISSKGSESIPPSREGMVLVHVMEGNTTAVGEGRTVEEAVDSLCENLLILPESSRRVWEEENVLRGEWVLPSPEEVEVYRTLGEELPFWWAPDKLAVWLSERAT